MTRSVVIGASLRMVKREEPVEVRGVFVVLPVAIGPGNDLEQSEARQRCNPDHKSGFYLDEKSGIKGLFVANQRPLPLPEVQPYMSCAFRRSTTSIDRRAASRARWTV